MQSENSTPLITAGTRGMELFSVKANRVAH